MRRSRVLSAVTAAVVAAGIALVVPRLRRHEQEPRELPRRPGVWLDAHPGHAAISGTDPTVAQATARVQQLAAVGASIVSADWRHLTTVLPVELPRG